MRIALVEHYTQSTNYHRSGRNAEWLVDVSHKHSYSFYHEDSKIPNHLWNKINEFTAALNKSHFETLEDDCYSYTPEYYKFDIEKSKELAQLLGCEVIKSEEFTIDSHKRNLYQNCPNDFRIVLAIKYHKIYNDRYFWIGEFRDHQVKIENGNLYNHGFRLDLSKADCIVTFYNMHEGDSLFGDQRFKNSLYAIIIKNNQYGAINKDGEVIVPYQDYRIIEVYNTFSIIEHKGDKSCMDHTGKVLIPFTASPLSIYMDRYAEVQLDTYKIIYDLNTTKIILIERYAEIISILDSCITIRNEKGQIDIYNHHSQKINSESFEEVAKVYEGIIVGKKATGWTAINYNGETILDDSENELTSMDIINGHIHFSKKKPNGYQIHGLADIQGRIILKCFADTEIRIIKSNENYTYIARKYKKDAIYNKYGCKISSEYDFIKAGEEDTCIAYNGEFRTYNEHYLPKGGMFYVLTSNGEEKFRIDCQNIFNYVGTLATFKMDGKYGKLDTNGNIIIPAMYDGLGIFSHGLAAAKINGKWGYININNKIAIEFDFDRVEDFNENGEAIVELDGQCNTINTKGDALYDWEGESCSEDSSYDSMYDDEYIRDGIAEAFNDDSSNYWNID